MLRRLTLGVFILAATLFSVSPFASAEIVKNIAFSPEGFPSKWNKIPEFFKEASSFSHPGVMQNGPWRDDAENGKNSGKIPQAADMVAKLASEHNYTPILVFSWRTDKIPLIKVPKNKVNNWSNQEARVLYKKMLVDFVAKHKPPFMFLGNENDFYYEMNPRDYENWLNFYNEAYDAIKAVSPDTQVGVTFNFEHLSGLGKLNAWTKDLWPALEKHDLNKMDIVGLSVYPFFQYATAGEVPDTYLDPIVQRIGSKPIAITESGWPSNNGGSRALWIASEEEQVKYLPKLARMIEGKNVSVVSWLYLNEPQFEGVGAIWKMFGSISLRSKEGVNRPVYDAWKSWNP